MSYLFADKKFLTKMARLASPIMLQQLVFASLGMIDTLMIGQLGDTAVAAVGIANQIFFLVTLLYFGITSGSAIFTAQYWGRKDTPRIHQVLGLSLLMSLVGGGILAAAALLRPTWIMGLYTTDRAVIHAGSDYLQITALSYILSAVSYSYYAILRSMEEVKLPTTVSFFALSLKSILNFGLIFGNLGLPEMGVRGAAIATLIARLVEVGLTFIFVYAKKLPLAVPIRNLFHWELFPFRKYFRTTLPVIITEIIWSLGSTTYKGIFAHISTESIASFNIATTLDNLIFVVFLGLGHACAIMIGNQIGSGNVEQAEVYGRKFLLLGLIGSVILGTLAVLLRHPILALYKVSPQTVFLSKKIILVMAVSLPVRSLDLIQLIGILRSGGDTVFAMLIDAGITWTVGVPMAMLGAFLFGLPIYWVYAMSLSEEILKASLGIIRFLRGKWIHPLTAPA